MITIDGAAGDVYAGALPLVPPRSARTSTRSSAGPTSVRRLGVRANADTPEDAARAREFGAEGIGLCRTEHMFMADGPPARRARDDPGRRRRGPRRGARRAPADAAGATSRGSSPPWRGLPVTIRLLDPPLHEFLPDRVEQSARTSSAWRADGDAAELRGAERLLGRVARAARAEPDARHARLPPGAAAPGDLRDAGARDRARRARGGRAGGEPRVGDHDPAGRLGRGAAAHARARRATSWPRSSRPPAWRARRTGRHDDRAAARGALRRRDRRARRLLLVRHQRPDADDARALARRRRGRASSPPTSRTA